jgi:hypothetical protein
MALSPVNFKLTAKRRAAAKDVAEDVLRDREIAAKHNISMDTLYAWKRNPVFDSCVAECIEEMKKHIRRRAISITEFRVNAKQDRWRGMQQIVDERAEDPAMQNVPGGSTGLLTHYQKSIGSGDLQRIVDVYEFDKALVDAMTEHEMSAARELGQLADKLELTGKDEGPISHRFDALVNRVYGNKADQEDATDEPGIRALEDSSGAASANGSKP